MGTHLSVYSERYPMNAKMTPCTLDETIASALEGLTKAWPLKELFV